MADISGHGVNAALLSGMVKTLAAPLMASGLPPGQVLAGLDSAIGQYFPDGYFCTGFYLIIDESTGAFDYAGVGHPPALVVGPGARAQLDSDRRPARHRHGRGDSAGGSDRLAPGESLLIYTDGLPDAMDPADVPFGLERIEAVLEANREAAGPAAILDAIDAGRRPARHARPAARRHQPGRGAKSSLVTRPSVVR